MAQFSQSGTLVGVAVTVTPFPARSTPAVYTEVHNLTAGDTFTVTINGVAFQLPPGRKLVVEDNLSSLDVLGTGNYTVIASDANSGSPRIESSANYSNVAAAGNPPDGVTLEDTGVVWRIKDLGVTGAKIAASAIDTSKLADLAVNFNKTASGLNQNPGRGAACTFNSGGVAPGDTLTLTFNAVPTTYIFQNAGLPAPAPGEIGVDIATINIDLPAKVMANQVLVSADMVGGIAWFGLSVQSLIQSGATLTALSTIPASTEDFPPVAESRVGLEFHQYAITAANAISGVPIYTSGTIVAKWFMETTPGGTQITPVGIGFVPLATGDGIVVSGSGAVGNLMNVILAVTY